MAENSQDGIPFREMASQNSDKPQLQDEQNTQIFYRSKRAFNAGRRLAQPPLGEDVVITGMSGKFPESDDIYQYRDNIFNKKDLLTADHRRWDLVNPEIPERSGKVNSVEKFDAGFFGIHWHQATTLDPALRQILEKAYEAIVDAGYNPKELHGTRTGVFVACCIIESEEFWFFINLESPNFGITGSTRSTQAQWISRAFGLIGPSVSVDTACSSSMTALDHAYKAIREGRCDSALVAGGNMCFSPTGTLQFSRLGVLSKDGACKSFDADANGYARSETVAVVYLQKAKDARRIYAQVLHAKLNCDGFKEHGITFPSGAAQKQLLSEIYQECQIDPATVDFLEAHATGTKVGDPEEIMAIDEVFCKSRKRPLHIGSIKSNLGHTEPASGLCSLVKVILSMENNCFIPNINYTKPRMEALKQGRLVVVTEKMPWISGGSGIAAINNFGFGGANGHVVLRRFAKQKINGGAPADELPRLICVSGRKEESVSAILNDFCGRALDAEYVRLLHAVFSKDIEAHPYRGYAIMSKTGGLAQSLGWCEEARQPFCLIFGGPNEELLNFGKQLLELPLFAAAFQRVLDILLSKDLNLSEILNHKRYRKPADIIIGSAAIQIALVDFLNDLQLHSDYVIGHSIGEVAAAYADNAVTLQEAVLVIYHTFECLRNTRNGITIDYEIQINGKTIQTILPNNVGIIKHTSNNSCVISGPFHETIKFVESLAHMGMPTATSTLHLGKNVKQISTKLLQHLKQVLPNPKRRSSKWITTSTQKDQSKIASAEYFVNNLSISTRFIEALDVIPRTAVVLQIGSKLINQHGDVPVHLRLTDDNSNNKILILLNILGRLYELGYNPKLEKLYPTVPWPVSVNTPMVSPLIKWNHSEDWFLPLHKNRKKLKSGERIFRLSIKENDWAFIAGHVIDGRNLIPATGYLLLVWETYSLIKTLTMTNMQVVFQNVRFHRATNVPKTGAINLFITIQKTTGEFEVAEIGETIVSGRMIVPLDFSNYVLNVPTSVSNNNNTEIMLTSKDIYKELKLRGYNYTGVFRGVKTCTLNATKGFIEWTGNWTAFMDNMLQMQILQEDTRNLYVPTYIEQLSIDAKEHIRYQRQLGENPEMPVYVYRDLKIIKSGAIQIRGLMASSIPRRKPAGVPVLETHKFVPFDTELPLEQSIRITSQLILENNYDIRLRVVEVLDEATKDDARPIGPIIYDVFRDQPLIQPDITIFSKTPIEMENVVVNDRNLAMENKEFSLVVVSNISKRPQVNTQAIGALKEHGFILSREEITFDLEAAEQKFSDLTILSINRTDTEALVLLRKIATSTATPMIIDISNDIANFSWLPKLQAAAKTDNEVLVYSQNDSVNGILGFINCLRREPEGSNVRCVFITETAPKFDTNAEFYYKQLKKGLAVNILKDSKWGTYRHFLLDTVGQVKSEHIFNNVTVKGDLSSLRWLEGPLTSKTPIPTEKVLVHVYYSSINFRDIMTASGRISGDVVTKDRLEQSLLQGFEFSGRDSNGKRVMGMVKSGALASMVIADSYLLLEIPDEWSMEEAATVPVTYCTVLYSLILIGRIKPYASILIHAGTGGVGQAAINIALHYKCNIFTTVGSKEKRDFIRKQFPQIAESHIGNSRDTSFEQMIFKETGGRGVDLVLNSLAEEKLQASVRCLAPGGKFLEIGKFDLENNKKVSSKLFIEGRSFNGVMLDTFFGGDPPLQNVINKLLTEALKVGCVKPLPRTIFKQEEVEQAFRYMAGGKHMGKIVINLREEENQKQIAPAIKCFSGIPRFFCNPNNCYIIIGGLGGFGMELADWLILRGAKKLVLISRTGLKTGYQISRIRIWKSYGVVINISTEDVTTREGCIAMINEANALGPVEGVFNLAVVLNDALLENLDKDKYLTSLAPKAVITRQLDIVTRELCPKLLHFVVFSSVSCGRGNAGQTNYGMANSIMERICEKRKNYGYPALAIQWGAIGEVGLVAEMQELQTEIEIGGTLQQQISSCMEVMDIFLNQNEPVVSSMVVAEKRGGAAGIHSITDTIINIMGIRDIKSISMHATFSQLGMDSMMAVEIKQTIEREYETFVSAQDIRGMTFARLQQLAEEKEIHGTAQVSNTDKKRKGIEVIIHSNMFIPVMVDEPEISDAIIRFPSLVDSNASAPNVIMLPGIDGLPEILETLAAKLYSHTFCLCFPFKNFGGTTIEALADSLLPHVNKILSSSREYIIIAYSYSSVIAMQMVAQLEKENRIGTIILIDGSPMMDRQLALSLTSDIQNSETLQTNVLCTLMRTTLPLERLFEIKEQLDNDCKTLEEKIDMLISNVPKNPKRSESYQKMVCRCTYYRANSVLIHKPTYKLKSRVYLFKPRQPLLPRLPHDYELQDLCENPVEVSTFEGTHLTILKNVELSHAINRVIHSSEISFKETAVANDLSMASLNQSNTK